MNFYKTSLKHAYTSTKTFSKNENDVGLPKIYMTNEKGRKQVSFEGDTAGITPSLHCCNTRQYIHVIKKAAM